jgi:hypothetical protein
MLPNASAGDGAPAGQNQEMAENNLVFVAMMETCPIDPNYYRYA